MYIVGITGASGAIIGIKVVEKLLESGESVGVIISKGGKATISLEILRDRNEYISMEELLRSRNFDFSPEKLIEYSNDDFFTPVASGSGDWRGIVVVPASMKTLSAIANGYSDNLITRGCDVAFKEGRSCVIVPRETPFSLIHLNNMTKIVQAGGKIVPPIPAFYHNPKDIDEVVDYIIEKIVKQLGVDVADGISWGIK